MMVLFFAFRKFFYLSHNSRSLDFTFFDHRFSRSSFSFQQFFSIFSQSHFSDDHIRWGNTDVNSRSSSFFSLNSFNVNDVFFSVGLDNFTGLFTFEFTSDDFDFIVFDQRHGSDVVFSSEFFGQSSGHDLSSLMRSSVEMGFSRSS